MTQPLQRPDYLFEVSWEVCNKVGGIYAVLSTKAATLVSELGTSRLFFIGPDLTVDGEDSIYFDAEGASPELKAWADKARQENLLVKVGTWRVPGNPQAVLVDFTPFFSKKDEFYSRLWEWYGVDSLHAYGDYDEGCIFSYASACVIESLYKHFCPQRSAAIAHFNEWTTGAGLLWLKHQLPSIATVFTTHATCVGRSICGNNKPLYDYLPGYFGDQMADELNMTSKHSVEKRAAQQADAFTTVSEITARECYQLLERRPYVTPNGFESGFVPKGVAFSRLRKQARSKLLRLVECVSGHAPADDAILVATAGRCEYHNKGLDIFLDSFDLLRRFNPMHEIIGFVMVPGWVQEPRADIKARMKSNARFYNPVGDPVFTHALNNYNEDVLLNRIHQLGFRNYGSDNVKVIYIPCYLDGRDGILNMTYYDLISGLDLSVFPSYYEPWGYTPLESCAFGVPTITTSLSGFGAWCREMGKDDDVTDGVAVIPRNDSNYAAVVDQIAHVIRRYADVWPSGDVKLARQLARKIASQADWRHFIRYYWKAYDAAIKTARERNK